MKGQPSPRPEELVILGRVVDWSGGAMPQGDEPGP
jgi:hypothetical protein